MSKHKILLLDDEPEVLKSLTRVLRKEYDVVCFTNGEEALNALEQHLFSVLISDMRMPKMDGATFLEKAHDVSPLSQTILLTGYSDPQDTSKAINQGHIDFYINKPWDNDDLLSKIKISMEKFINEYQQKLINKQVMEQNLKLRHTQEELTQQLQQTEKTSEAEKAQALAKVKQYFHNTAEVLSSCIQMFTQDPFAHGERIASQVTRLCHQFNFSPLITYQTTIAARLYQIGKFQTPQNIVLMSEEEQQAESLRNNRASYVTLSSELLKGFTDFTGVAAITKHIFEHVDGSGGPSGLSGDKVPVPCQIVQICALFDKMVTGKNNGEPMVPAAALALMFEQKNRHISPKVFKAFKKLIENLSSSSDLPTEYAVTPKMLKPGMSLARDLPLEAAKSNYLNKGHVLTDDNIDSLKKIQDNKNTPLILFVFPHIVEEAEKQGGYSI